MKPKAISTVIASILMLMIVIGLAGTSYLFISGAFTSKTATAFEIVESFNDTVTIRNDGTESITFRSATLDGNTANFQVSNGNTVLALQNPQSHTVRVESKGLLATTGDRGVWIDETKVFTPGRSYGLVVLDNNAQVTFSQTYDVYENAANAGTLASKLDSLSDGTIIVISTWDEPRNNRLTNNLPQALKRCGASTAIFESPNFKFRSAYLLVGVCGNGENTGLEKYAGTVDGDINAWVRGDVTIGGGVNPGNTATIKVYGIVTKGTHTLRLCTSSMCNIAFLTIT